MDINLSISAAPGITTNHLVEAVYLSTAPSTVVAYQDFPPPHTDFKNVSFTDLLDGVYICILWESPDGLPGGVIRHQFIYDPSYQNARVREDLPLVVGIDITANQNSYTRADLKGWTYSVERRGTGTLVNVTEITIDTDGGFELALPGDIFLDGETVILHFQPQITTVIPGANQQSGVLFSDTVEITEDVTLDATYMGKFLRLAADDVILTVTLPVAASVADNKLIAFLSEGGNHVNATIACATGEYFKWKGQELSAIYIGQSEEIWIYKQAGYWRVSHADGNFKNVGEIVHGIIQDDINTHFLNGELVDRDVYCRIWNDFIPRIDASMIVSDADWNFQDPATGRYPNHNKFSTGDGSTTFRFPIMYETGFLKSVDGTTRKALSFEDWMMPIHKHESTIGTLPTSLFGRSPYTRIIGRYGGSPASGGADLSNTPCDTDGNLLTANVGSQNRPQNDGIYLSIRI